MGVIVKTPVKWKARRFFWCSCSCRGFLLPLLALAHNNPPIVSEVYILTEEWNIFWLIYAMSFQDERDPWFSLVRLSWCLLPTMVNHHCSPPFPEYVLFFSNHQTSKSKFLCLVSDPKKNWPQQNQAENGGSFPAFSGLADMFIA